MPNYEYKCKECAHIMLFNHGYEERPELTCEVCQSGDVVKMVSLPTVVFKGSGWGRKESANKAAGIPKEVAETAEKLGRI